MAEFQILPGVTDAPTNTPTFKMPDVRGANPQGSYIEVKPGQYQLWSGRYGKIGESAGMLQSIASGDRAVEFPDLSEFSSTIGLDATDMGPEGGTSMGDAARRLAAYTTGLTRKEQAQIIRGIEGARMTRDKFDNPIVEYKGQKFYVNKPGATGADLTTFFATVGSFMPFGRLARIVQKATGGGRLAGVATQGAAGGLQQVTLDETGRALGADQRADLLRTAISTLGAGAGEFLGQALSRALSSYKLGNEVRRLLGGERAYVNKDGSLSDTARQTMKAMGVDPDAVEADIAKQVLQVARGGGTEPTRKAVAEALPLESEFGVTLRPGQRIGEADKTVAQREDLIMAGDDRAAATLRGDGPNPLPASVEGQRQAAVTALRETQEKVSGVPNVDADITRRTDIIDDIAVGLQTGREAAKDAEQVAWEAAKPMMNGVQILFEGVKQIKPFIRRGLDEKDFLGVVTKANTPEAFDLLKGLNKQISVYQRRADSGDVSNIRVNMKTIEMMRRSIVARLGQKNIGDTDFAALVTIKNSFDDWMDDVFSSALVKGDAAALDALKQARSASRVFNQRYTANKTIEQITREEMDPRTVVQSLGLMNQKGFGPNALKVVQHIKNNFDDDAVGNQTLQRLKAATFMSFHENAIKPVERGGETVFSLTGQTVSNNINQILRQNKRYMEELFTPGEIKKLRRYATMLRRVSYLPQRDRSNPSQSGTTFARALKNLTTGGGGGAGTGLFGYALLSHLGVTDMSAIAAASVAGSAGAALGKKQGDRLANILRNMRVGNELTRRPLIDKPLSATAPAAVGADVSQVPVTGAEIEAAREKFPSLGAF